MLCNTLLTWLLKKLLDNDSVIYIIFSLSTEKTVWKLQPMGSSNSNMTHKHIKMVNDQRKTKWLLRRAYNYPKQICIKFYLIILIPLIYTISHCVLFWKFVQSSSSLFISRFLLLPVFLILLPSSVFWPACLLSSSGGIVFRLVTLLTLILSFLFFSSLCSTILCGLWLSTVHFSDHRCSHCIAKKSSASTPQLYSLRHMGHTCYIFLNHNITIIKF